MKVDFNKELMDLNGKPMNEIGGPATVKEALLASGVSAMVLDHAMAALRPFFGSAEVEERRLAAHRVVANALQAHDAALSGADKVDRIRLAIKCMDPKQPVDVSEKEKTVILTAVDRMYGPLIYTRIHELFNGSVVEATGE